MKHITLSIKQLDPMAWVLALITKAQCLGFFFSFFFIKVSTLVLSEEDKLDLSGTGKGTEGPELFKRMKTSYSVL